MRESCRGRSLRGVVKSAWHTYVLPMCYVVGSVPRYVTILGASYCTFRAFAKYGTVLDLTHFLALLSCPQRLNARHVYLVMMRKVDAWTERGKSRKRISGI